LNLLSRNYLDFDDYIQKAPKPIKILFVGVNGTGKTTSIAKVARYLSGPQLFRGLGRWATPSGPEPSSSWKCTAIIWALRW